MQHAFNFELMQQIKEIAAQKQMPVEFVMEEAVQWYVDSQSIQLLEKQLPNGSFRVVTLHPYGVCIEHITKRINIDSFKDTALLLEDGYYPILPKGIEDD